jgi:hemoglobin
MSATMTAMTSVDEPTLYQAAGGYEGLLALAHAWHERCLEDPIMSHPFSHAGGHPQHLERLAAYWGEALGGPPAYTATMGGHSYVLRMHAGNGEHLDMDRRAVSCFEQAVSDVGLSGDPRLSAALIEYFAWATAAMSAHPDSAATVPDDAPLPRWSWDGLQQPDKPTG